MVIDFHTHIFPEKIARRTIEKLESISDVIAATDGTREGLIASMKENGVDYSVVLPVMTKPSQFETVNEYARSINGVDGIISFGGIHPDCEDYEEKLGKIKEMGLKGIKLHPDYQQTFIDEERYVKIIDAATNLGLVVVIHAGLDVGLQDIIHCTPKRAKNLLDQLTTKQERKIVFAHTGGFECWDGVEEYLVKEDVYLDISFSLGKIKNEQFLAIVRNHGVHRMLFATDSPWSSQGETIRLLKELPLTKGELDQILFENAKRLIMS